MVVRTGKVPHHEIPLRIRQHHDQTVLPLCLALDTMPGSHQLVGMRLPGLLAGEPSGKMLQRWMLPCTQEENTPLRAKFGIHIEGVNEGVESVLGVGHRRWLADRFWLALRCIMWAGM